ncbi:hypothetical protein [Streptomyces cyaneofuscatus]|uniref:hypothetical protein n=1 Tax=Streptomyces cyaneofuscatus TaxID=66883 RepID=UPI0036A83C4D
MFAVCVCGTNARTSGSGSTGKPEPLVAWADGRLLIWVDDEITDADADADAESGSTGAWPEHGQRRFQDLLGKVGAARSGLRAPWSTGTAFWFTVHAAPPRRENPLPYSSVRFTRYAVGRLVGLLDD